MAVEVEVYSHPSCGYCYQAKALLESKDVPFKEINIFQQPEQLPKMVELTGRRSFPQVIINGQPIGGYTDLLALDRSGELEELIGQPS